MSKFIIPDCEGKMVEIFASEIGELLSMTYFGDYEGKDNIEDFIDWFMNDCPDEEDDDDEEF